MTSSDSRYYSQGIAEKRNLTRVQVDNDLVRFNVLQPRNRRKMNLTRVHIDNDLVRFKVLQPRNRRKLNPTRVKVDNDLVRFLIVCHIGELLVEAHEFSFYYSVRGDIAISGYVG